MKTVKGLLQNEPMDSPEYRIAQALPKVVRVVTSNELKMMILSHVKETEGHVKKLETVFKSFTSKVKGKKCRATCKLLKDVHEIVTSFKGSTVIHTAIISLMEKMEHQEIASYGCLHEWAALLENRNASGLLKDILVEEKAENQALIELARSRGNTEVFGECKVMDFGRNGKAQKSLKTKTRMRPLYLNNP